LLKLYFRWRWGNVLELVNFLYDSHGNIAVGAGISEGWLEETYIACAPPSRTHMWEWLRSTGG